VGTEGGEGGREEGMKGGIFACLAGRHFYDASFLLVHARHTQTGLVLPGAGGSVREDMRDGGPGASRAAGVTIIAQGRGWVWQATECAAKNMPCHPQAADGRGSSHGVPEAPVAVAVMCLRA